LSQNPVRRYVATEREPPIARLLRLACGASLKLRCVASGPSTLPQICVFFPALPTPRHFLTGIVAFPLPRGLKSS
jgi:hypothetical protein